MAGKDNEHHRPALAQKKHAPEKTLPEWLAGQDAFGLRIVAGSLLMRTGNTSIARNTHPRSFKLRVGKERGLGGISL